MATLADVIRKKRSGGQSRTGSLFGSLKDKLKETIDPRQLINQTGILTAMFPSLKAFKAKGMSSEVGKKLNTKSTELISSSAQMSEIDLSVIAINTEIAAKNTMILPNLSRDVNVMRQNISKLVKASGQKPETKADSYFKKSKEREEEYEKKVAKKSPKSLTKKEDIENTDNKSDSSGLLGTLGKLISGLISSVVGFIKFIIGSLVGIIKGLLSTLITSMTSLIKNIFTKMLGTVLDIFKKIGSSLLSAIGFIKGAVLPFLQRLMMSPAGAAIILAALVYMGLQQLAKDFIKGKKAQDRLKYLRKLDKDGKLTPEERVEMRTLEDAGVTTSTREAQLRSVKETLDPVTVNTLLNDPKVTDEDIKRETGVSREILEAYREALANRNIMAKNHIPVPTLHDVAKSFGEKIERGDTSPTQTATSQVTSDVKPELQNTSNKESVSEDLKTNNVKSLLSPTQESDAKLPKSSAVLNLTKSLNETKKSVNTNTVTVLPDTKIQNSPKTSIPKSSVIPDVVNIDYPLFEQMHY